MADDFQFARTLMAILKSTIEMAKVQESHGRSGH